MEDKKEEIKIKTFGGNFGGGLGCFFVLIGIAIVLLVLSHELIPALKIIFK